MSDSKDVMDLASTLIIGALMGLTRAREVSDLLVQRHAQGLNATVADIEAELDEGDLMLLEIEAKRLGK